MLLFQHVTTIILISIFHGIVSQQYNQEQIIKNVTILVERGMLLNPDENSQLLTERTAILNAICYIEKAIPLQGDFSNLQFDDRLVLITDGMISLDINTSKLIGTENWIKMVLPSEEGTDDQTTEQTDQQTQQQTSNQNITGTATQATNEDTTAKPLPESVIWELTGVEMPIKNSTLFISDGKIMIDRYQPQLPPFPAPAPAKIKELPQWVKEAIEKDPQLYKKACSAYLYPFTFDILNVVKFPGALVFHLTLMDVSSLRFLLFTNNARHTHTHKQCKKTPQILKI